MREQSVEIYFFLIIFAGVLGLTFFILLPYLGTLAIAAVFAVLFYPLFEYLKQMFRVSSGVSATLVILIVLGGVLLPLTALGYLLFLEARDLVTHLDVSNGNVEGLLAYTERYVESILPDFELNLSEYTGQAVNALSQGLGSIFARTADAIFSLFIGFIAFFYFLKDGDRLGRSLIAHSPLKDSHDREIVERLRGTINSVVKGSLLVALIQGVLSGVGFAIFGVPNPVLLGMLAGIGALVPAVGTALVIVPAVLYLFFSATPAVALGLAIWGVLAVGLVDNILGPQLVGRGTHIHPLFVLLAVLGGLSLLGPMGFILGPIILSLLIVLFQIYALMLVKS